MTDEDTETVDADAVTPRDLTPQEAITPDLTKLGVWELAAILDNDRETYPLAGQVEVPAALEELQRRAAWLDDQGPGLPADVATVAAEAAQVLMARRLPAPPLPDGDPLLAAHGFGLTRERLTTAGRDIASVPTELIDATIRFAEQALTKARLAGAADNHLDAIDVDVHVLKAIRKLRLELKAIGERQAARQRIRG